MERKMTTTSHDIARKKTAGQRITMLTCYDYPTALWQDEAGVDVILVGDSVGTNVLGYRSEKEVTLDDMAHHLKAVRRGIENSYLLVDLPNLTYETPEQALESASRLADLGADGVKLEGFRPAIVEHLVNSGIEVCAHLGLTPQLHRKKGLRAKTAAAAAHLITESITLQEAGAWIIVYEMIPEEVGRAATSRMTIPTIGIGAGRFTDGQVLVTPDLLGITPFDLRHSRKYEDFHEKAVRAIRRHVADVQSGVFPAEGNVRHLDEGEREALEEMLGRATSAR